MMTDVVTASPSSNEPPAPLMKPDMEPSAFCFHFDMVGTPRGALAAVGVVLAILGEADCFGTGFAEDAAPPPNRNNENVGRPLTGGTDLGASFGRATEAFLIAFFAGCCVITLGAALFFGAATFCTVSDAPSAPLEGCLNAAIALSAASRISASRLSLALRSSSCCLSISVTAGLSLAMNSLRAASVKR